MGWKHKGACENNPFHKNGEIINFETIIAKTNSNNQNLLLGIIDHVVKQGYLPDQP